MSVESALAAGRAFAESLMTDACRVGVWSKSAEPDPVTLDYSWVLDPVVYEGPCEFLAGATEARVQDSQGQVLVVQASELRLPMVPSEAVEDGMRVEVTSSLTDPALVGTVATIRAPFKSAHVTARRFPVEVVS